MAESKSGGEKGKKILSYVAKRSRRAQEKVMQRMGKSEQTRDEVYTEFVVNFNRQQLNAARLHKELEKYWHKVKALQTATKSLFDLCGELYEPEWKGANDFMETKSKKLQAWEDMLGSFNSQLMEPMLQYLSKFPETKKLVEKRERKVVDYDMRRRELEALRQKQKATDQKIQQSQDSYQQAKLAFDDITDQLYEELPTVYDSRIQFYSSLFRNMGAMEAKFHEEMTKTDQDLASIAESLFADADSGAYTSRKERIIDVSVASLSPKTTEDNDSCPSEEDNSHTESFASAHGEPAEDSSLPISSTETRPTKPTPSSKPPKPTRTASTIKSDRVINNIGHDVELPAKPPKPSEDDNQRQSREVDEGEISKQEKEDAEVEQDLAGESREVDEGETDKEQQEEATMEQELACGQEGKEEDKEGDKEDVSDKTTTGDGSVEKQETEVDPTAEPDSEKPTTETSDSEEPKKETPSTEEHQKQTPEILYKVVAAHPYTGEDDDELSFEKGEVICVIPFEDPDDQEEGWRFGKIESSGRKGMFPENFTKRL